MATLRIRHSGDGWWLTTRWCLSPALGKALSPATAVLTLRYLALDTQSATSSQTRINIQGQTDKYMLSASVLKCGAVAQCHAYVQWFLYFQGCIHIVAVHRASSLEIEWYYMLYPWMNYKSCLIPQWKLTGITLMTWQMFTSARKHQFKHALLQQCQHQLPLWVLEIIKNIILVFAE